MVRGLPRLLVPVLTVLGVLLVLQGRVDGTVSLHLRTVTVLAATEVRPSVLRALTPTARDHLQTPGPHLASARLELILRMAVVVMRPFFIGQFQRRESPLAEPLQRVTVPRPHRLLVTKRVVLLRTSLPRVLLHELSAKDRLCGGRGTPPCFLHLAVALTEFSLLVPLVAQATALVVIRLLRLVTIALVEPCDHRFHDPVEKTGPWPM